MAGRIEVLEPLKVGEKPKKLIPLGLYFIDDAKREKLQYFGIRREDDGQLQISVPFLGGTLFWMNIDETWVFPFNGQKP